MPAVIDIDHSAAHWSDPPFTYSEPHSGDRGEGLSASVSHNCFVLYRAIDCYP